MKKSSASSVSEMLGPCPLCERLMISGSSVNQHHLIPKSEGGVEQFYMHRICHHKLHATFSEKELASYYFTWDRLKSHEQIRKFVSWIKKKPPEYYDRNDSSRR